MIIIIMHVQGQSLDEFIEISPVVEISEDHLFLVKPWAGQVVNF